jgi:hypothetical protein
MKILDIVIDIGEVLGSNLVRTAVYLVQGFNVVSFISRQVTEVGGHVEMPHDRLILAHFRLLLFSDLIMYLYVKLF